MPPALAVLAGLVLLLAGAEAVVRSGVGLATWWGLKPVVVGLTVISVGTSLPELAVGVDAVWSGSPDVATGNIVGTNLVNLLLVLGIGALVKPVLFERRTLVVDLPAMVAAAALFLLLARDAELSTADGLTLCAAAILYTVVLVRTSRQEDVNVVAEARPGPVAWVGLLVVGIAVTVLGAALLVDGAVSSARALGLSEAVIGLTVVAVGTSAPELVTLVVSTVRGEPGLAVGNVIGSNIFNILLVLGITVLVAPGPVPVPAEVVQSDLVLLVGATLAAAPLMVSGARITRWEGGALVLGYLGYVAWLLATRI